MQKVTGKQNILNEPRIINIFDRQKIEITGVKEIVSSTEKEVYVKLSDGIMHILGSGLMVVKLVPEEEFLMVSGQINGLNFISKMTKKSLFGKVFKWDFLEIFRFCFFLNFCGQAWFLVLLRYFLSLSQSLQKRMFML